MGKNLRSLKPKRQENAHWKQDLRIMKKRNRSLRMFWSKKIFIKFKKDTPNKRDALNRTENSPYQKLATKIKAFQSVFEVKDLALYGMCRQVNILA